MEPNWLDARMIRLQRPGRPWSIMLRAELVEPVGIGAVDKALGLLVSGRPELAVTLAVDGKRISWSEADQPRAVVSSASSLLDAEPLLSGGALLVALDVDPSTSLTLAVNHGLTDGIGLVSILEDLLTALNGSPPTPRPQVRSEDLDRYIEGARLRIRGLLPPLGVQVPATDEALPTALATRRIPLAALDASCHRYGMTITSLLLGSVHTTLADEHWSGRHILVSVPIDVRRRSDFGDGIGNAVVAVSTRSKPDASFADRARLTTESLLASVDDNRVAERLRAYRTFTRPGPPRTKSSRRSRLALETAVLSNLGRIAHKGAWQSVKELAFAPPAHCTISFGVVTLGPELSITVRAKARPELVSRLGDRLVALVGD